MGALGLRAILVRESDNQGADPGERTMELRVPEPMVTDGARGLQ